MQLKEILSGVEVCEDLGERANLEISDIKIDSRNVEKGDLFIALKGEKVDGNNFIEEALSNGASAVLTENPKCDKCVKVRSSRKAYALSCKNFFGRACEKLKIIAVTGTNGKTTIASTTKEILQYAGAKVDVIGTLGASGENGMQDTGFTTPDPYILHKLFSQMNGRGSEFVVMEASAHALALDKLEGINFEIGVLTNITEDHLDYFGNMENYAEAKYKLFDKVRLGIVCDSDRFCQKLILNPPVPIITYGLSENCDVRALNIKKTLSFSSFECDYMGEKFPLKSNLVGEYNVKNALASTAICRALGVPSELIKLGLSCVNQVEGRFNLIQMGGVNIIIDFAHTPDGLENLLKSAKELTKGKLVVVFGCGGNRDKTKRAIMGKVAEKYADRIILTSDNPRYENPHDIISQIRRGVKGDAECIENRKDAIEHALSSANESETIVIAGKGGEKYQEIKGVKTAYNDFDVVYNYFRNKFSLIEFD